MASRPSSQPGLTLDAGALIAFERRDPRMMALTRRALANRVMLVVPVGAVAQAWRGGARGGPIASLLAHPLVRVEELTLTTALAAGELCATHGTSDVIDASIVIAARRYGGRVVTSDAGDLLRLDPRLDVHV